MKSVWNESKVLETTPRKTDRYQRNLFENGTENKLAKSPKKLFNSSPTTKKHKIRLEYPLNYSKQRPGTIERPKKPNDQSPPRSSQKFAYNSSKESRLAAMLFRKTSIGNKSPSPSSYQEINKQSLNDTDYKTNMKISSLRHRSDQNYEYSTFQNEEQSSQLTSLFTEDTSIANHRVDTQGKIEKHRAYTKSQQSSSLKQSPAKVASVCSNCELLIDEISKQKAFYEKEICALETQLKDSKSNYQFLQSEMQRLDAKTKAITKDAAILIQQKNKELELKNKEVELLLKNQSERVQKADLSDPGCESGSRFSTLNPSPISKQIHKEEWNSEGQEEILVNEAILRDFYAQIILEKKINAELKGEISKLKVRVKESMEEGGKTATNHSSISEIQISKKPTESLLHIKPVQEDSKNDIKEQKEAYQQAIQTVFQMYKQEKLKSQNLETKIQKLTAFFGNTSSTSIINKSTTERALDDSNHALPPFSHRKNHSSDRPAKYEYDAQNRQEIKHAKNGSPEAKNHKQSPNDQRDEDKKLMVQKRRIELVSK